jgi:hypothetical protein
MLGAAALGYGWFRARAPLTIAEVQVGLRGVRLCVGRSCESYTLAAFMGGRGGLFRAVAALTWWCAMASAVLLVVGGALRARGVWAGRKLLRLGAAGAPIAAGLGLLAFATFPGRASVDWGFWLMLVGAALCFVGGFMAGTEDVGEGTTFVPVVAPAAAVGGAAPAPARPRHERAATPASAGPGPARRTAAQVPDAAADAAARALRFVLKQLDLGADVLVATPVEGVPRTVALADLVAVRAAQLPPEAPYARAVVVDLVPRAGAPVRVTAATRANYAMLPGQGATSLENQRRLVAWVREARPGLAVDEDTARFATGGLPVVLATPRAFAEWEARYGGDRT